MFRLRFSKVFKARLSEKLMELGNLTIGALVLGQFVSDRPFSAPVFIVGVVLAVLCYSVSYLISY